MTQDDDEDTRDVESTLAHMEGLQGLLDDDLPRAQRSFERVIELGVCDRDVADAREYLARIYFDAGEQQKGSMVVEQLLQETPTKLYSFETRQKLLPRTDLQWAIIGSELLEQQGATHALAYFRAKEQLISRLPETHMPCLYLQLGETYFQLRQYSEAATAWEKCLKAEIGYPPGHHAQAHFERVKRVAQNNLANLRQHGVGGQTSNNCWISSAAFGSNSAVTSELRHFRDEILCNLPGGKRLIIEYSRTAPMLAVRMNQHAWLRLTLGCVVVLPAYCVARVALRLYHRVYSM